MQLRDHVITTMSPRPSTTSHNEQKGQLDRRNVVCVPWRNLRVLPFLKPSDQVDAIYRLPSDTYALDPDYLYIFCCYLNDLPKYLEACLHFPLLHASFFCFFCFFLGRLLLPIVP